jgi:hypothetical protein
MYASSNPLSTTLHTVYAFDAATGRVQFTVELAAGAASLGGLQTANGMLYFSVVQYGANGTSRSQLLAYGP